MPTPIPIAIRTGRLVLFGGSFDPPHRAHLFFARFLLDRLPDARLLMVPAARSPHKDAPTLFTGRQRVRMLGLGLGDVGLVGESASAGDRAAIWTDELDRAESGGAAGPSYWVETLRRARAQLPPEVAISFVIGSDQLGAFARWREPHEILRLAWPIVLVRGGGAIEDGSVVDAALALRVLAWLDAPVGDGVPSAAWSDEERALFAAGVLLGQPTLAISSTRVRALLADEPGSPELDAMLTPGVAAYLRPASLHPDPESVG